MAKEYDLDDAIRNLLNDIDKSHLDDERTTFVPTEYENFLEQSTNNPSLISDVLALLQSVHTVDYVTVDPSFSKGIGTNFEATIATYLDNYIDNYIKYPSRISTREFKYRGQNIQYSMWSKRQRIMGRNNDDYFAVGRSHAISNNYSVTIDRFLLEDEPEILTMILQFDENKPSFVKNALILDATKGYEPYKNGYLFSADIQTAKKFSTASGIQEICNTLIPSDSAGYIPTPEFV